MAAMTAAHWFDHRRFLLEADRVLRPGGCLALVSYTMDMELEYGDVSGALNDICKEVLNLKKLNPQNSFIIYIKKNTWDS